MKGGIIIILVAYLLIFTMECAKPRRKKLGPIAKHKLIKSCAEVASTARFNPYSVLDDLWVVFFYWGAISNLKMFKFAVPSRRNIEVLHKYLNDSLVRRYPVNWTKPLFVMTEKHTRQSYLLVQMGDRGEFLRYDIMPRKLKKGMLITPDDLNFKQIDNGKYLVYIECRNNNTYMMSRPRDVPKKQIIQDVAAKMGYRGRGGRSYLYQGHQWMPIDEYDDYEPEMFNSYKYNDLLMYEGNDPRRRGYPRKEHDLRFVYPRRRADDNDNDPRPDVRHPDDPRHVDDQRLFDDPEPDRPPPKIEDIVVTNVEDT